MPQSLLFIPDISGFTNFVNSTEVEHGRHVIAELLDLIIESDRLGLTVSELEGDAVLFYLDGRVPSVESLVAQARHTFTAFHAKLKEFEARRICDCGACVEASGLTLKIVAHAGPIELMEVRGFTKLYGGDVIVAHRLLKNDIDEAEYLLLTDAVSVDGEDPTPPGWSTIHPGTTLVEELGEVPFKWIPLGPLRSTVADPPPLPPLPKSPNPVVHSTCVDAVPAEVFELVSNFDLRSLWNDGVDEIEYQPDRVNRVGTPHRCVIGGRLVEFETVTNDFGDGRRVYGELLPGAPIVDDLVNYFIVEAEGQGTRLTLESHYRSRSLPWSLLNPIIRRRLTQLGPRLLRQIEVAAQRQRVEIEKEAAIAG